MLLEIKKKDADYNSPVCTPVEISSEGILCESGENESYDEVLNYGADVENRGWN